MKETDIERVFVELEETEDGRKRLKRSKSGQRPMDILAEILAEQEAEFKKLYNRDLFQWGTYDEPGEPGERPHIIFVLYSLETGEKVPVRRFIMWDAKEDKPVPIPQPILKHPGRRSMDRADTLEHVGNFLDFKKMERAAEERGLHLQKVAAGRVLQKAQDRMEG